jgi:hypothetical protein
MRHRALTWVLILALLTPATGCKVNRTVRLDPAAISQPGAEKIVGITTTDGRDIRFDPPGATVRDQTLQASVNGAPFQLPLDRVQRFWVERRETSKARTIGLIAAVTVGVVLVAGAVALATKQSCPFIYSWDGSQFVFDAEPYGGAITRGLERDDYAELEHLRAENGLYRLLITNEVPETQYTNLMELQVVDHAAGIRVAVDEGGRLHTLAESRRLISARDRAGRDLLPWLADTDRLIWEGEPIAEGSAREEIVLTFPKPAGATRAKLVANAATGLWGSYMIKAMLELRGRDLEAWYAALDRQPTAADTIFAWNLREELYALKLYLEEPTGWELRGLLPGGGPFMAEDRAVMLDVSRVTGEQMKVRLRPPGGFWALNSFVVDYGPDQPLEVVKVRPLKAWDEGGRDVLAELTKTDDAYYVMPVTENRAWINFPAPPPRPGLERTIFLHSRGYYRLHLTGQGSPDAKALQRFSEVPDAAARFAARRYREWRRASAPR